MDRTSHHCLMPKLLASMAIWIFKRPSVKNAIPIATQMFYGAYASDMGCILAALILAMLPILILYLVMQKYIVEGVTSGAVKG